MPCSLHPGPTLPTGKPRSGPRSRRVGVVRPRQRIVARVPRRRADHARNAVEGRNPLSWKRGVCPHRDNLGRRRKYLARRHFGRNARVNLNAIDQDPDVLGPLALKVGRQAPGGAENGFQSGPRERRQGEPFRVRMHLPHIAKPAPSCEGPVPERLRAGSIDSRTRRTDSGGGHAAGAVGASPVRQNTPGTATLA